MTTPEPAQPVTILITAEPSHRFVLHPGLPFLTVTFPEAPVTSMDVPLSNPGVTVIPGDVRETLAQMARDAITYHEGCADEGHSALVERYEAVLGAIGGTE